MSGALLRFHFVLPIQLLAVVAADAAQELVVVRGSVQSLIPVLNLALQLNGLVEVCRHELLLHFLAILQYFLVVFEVTLVAIHNGCVELAHLTLLPLLLAVLEADHVHVVLVHLALTLHLCLLLRVFHRILEHHVLLNRLSLTFAHDLIHTLTDLLFGHGFLQLFTVLLLQELFADLGF